MTDPLPEKNALGATWWTNFSGSGPIYLGGNYHNDGNIQTGTWTRKEKALCWSIRLFHRPSDLKAVKQDLKTSTHIQMGLNLFFFFLQGALCTSLKLEIMYIPLIASLKHKVCLHQVVRLLSHCSWHRKRCLPLDDGHTPSHVWVKEDRLYRRLSSLILLFFKKCCWTSLEEEKEEE